MNALLEWDRRAQAAVEGLAGGLLDVPMHVASELAYWAPLILGAWVWLVWRGGPRGRALAIVALGLVLLSDQGSSAVLKPLFGRPRPHSDLPGFPSSHASNLFAQATLFSWAYPRLTAAVFALASVVGFSRVYLGKHYPLDVLGGAVFGALCGALAIVVLRHNQTRTERAWVWIFSRLPGRPEDLAASDDARTP